jgi:hypothetical protein
VVSPAPDPPGRDDDLVFYIGPGVSDFDRSLIIRAVEVTREVLRDESGLEPPAAVFAYESVEQLADAFASGALAQRWRASELAQRLSETVAEASFRGIAIATGARRWKELDPPERLRIVSHEFVHVIQLEHAGEVVADESFTGSIVQAPPLGPFWLLEGSAEVVSWIVLQELGFGSYAEALLEYARCSRSTTKELAEMEGYVGYAHAGRPGLCLSVLATDYLLRSRSLSRLFDFWREVGRGVGWEAAFTRSFGLPHQFLYGAFEQYYEATWAGSTN